MSTTLLCAATTFLLSPQDTSRGRIELAPTALLDASRSVPVLAMTSSAVLAPGADAGIIAVHGIPAHVTWISHDPVKSAWGVLRSTKLPDSLAGVQWIAATKDVDGDGSEDVYIGFKAPRSLGDCQGVALFSGAKGNVINYLVEPSSRVTLMGASKQASALTGVLYCLRGEALEGASSIDEYFISKPVPASNSNLSALAAIKVNPGSMQMALLGDVNRDGVTDVATVARDLDVPRRPSISILSPTDGRVIRQLGLGLASQCLDAAERLAIVGLDDLNGDSVDDYAVVGHRVYGSGCLSVINGASGQPLMIVKSPSSEDMQGGFGEVVVSVNDVDGDSISEVLVANPTEVGERGVIGAVYLVSSKSGSILDSLLGERDMDDLGSRMAVLWDPSGKRSPFVAVTIRGTVRVLTVTK